MNVRIVTSSYVQDFVLSEINAVKVYQDLADLINTNLKIDDEKIKDWEIQFSFIYNNGDSILIFHKGRTYPNEKYKEVTVHIPIPNKDEASWGVEREQFVYKDKNHLDPIKKNSEIVEVDFSSFDNRKDYILDSMKRAIKVFFAKGTTLNGVKVKTDNIG